MNRKLIAPLLLVLTALLYLCFTNENFGDAVFYSIITVFVLLFIAYLIKDNPKQK